MLLLHNHGQHFPVSEHVSENVNRDGGVDCFKINCFIIIVDFITSRNMVSFSNRGLGILKWAIIVINFVTIFL